MTEYDELVPSRSMGVCIDREAACAAMPDDYYGWRDKKALESIPAADVRPVVLCKDCEYCRRADEFEYWCYGFCSPAQLVRKDDFCSHGKAKECVPYFPAPPEEET